MLCAPVFTWTIFPSRICAQRATMEEVVQHPWLLGSQESFQRPQYTLAWGHDVDQGIVDNMEVRIWFFDTYLLSFFLFFFGGGYVWWWFGSPPPWAGLIAGSNEKKGRGVAPVGLADAPFFFFLPCWLLG